MSWPHDFCYGINCPDEPPLPRCECCNEELLYSSYQYLDQAGRIVGCIECVDENENIGSLQCCCDNFNKNTEYVYTRHGCTTDGQLEILGCSECLRVNYA